MIESVRKYAFVQWRLKPMSLPHSEKKEVSDCISWSYAKAPASMEFTVDRTNKIVQKYLSEVSAQASA